MAPKEKKVKDIPIEFKDEKSEKSSTMEEPERAAETVVEKPAEQEPKKTSRKKEERESGVSQLQAEIEQLKKQIEELKEQNLRLRSEFANYKRRVEREQIELADYIKSEFIKKLLPVLDDFQHMFEKADQNSSEQTVIEGARMIYNKFFQVLKNEGLEKIEAVGNEFDPQEHEAMMMQNVDSIEHHNRIINVFQEGYRLRGRLIRPSRVVVGKFEENKEEAETTSEKN